MTLTADVLEDPLAVSLARALAAANRRAQEVGVNALQSRITVTQQIADDASLFWRINYGPQDPVGRRGGDLLIEVNADDASIRRTLRGQ